MNQRSPRIPILIAATLVLGALVIADRAGMLPGSAAADPDSLAESAASRYAAASAESSADAALLSRAAAWSAAAEQAETEWKKVSAGLVRGATPELAETRFREIVKSAIHDIPLVSPERITYLREGIAARGPVQTLRLSVVFDAPTPKAAYTIIDRLENLPDARARIEQLKIDGPGRIQSPEQVTVTMTLTAAALIGDEGSTS
ncbi:MAG: hypothetical protein JNK58_04210 [Phycisphaerae bacterium]|nr:hypothetical protein [Phycisphaerae bacterium]